MNIKQLTTNLSPNEAILLTSPQSLKYYTNYVGSNGTVFAFDGKAYFFTDFRYIEQVKRDCVGFTLIEIKSTHETASIIKEKCEANNITTIYFEESHMTVKAANAFKEQLNNIQFKDGDARISEPRKIKSESEVQAIAKAAAIADQAFNHLIRFIQRGMTEKEIAIELEFTMKKQGATALSFDSIIAAGPNGAMPHATPSNRPLQDGDLVVMDYGCMVDGYCSDMTRTIAMGEISDELRNIYDITFQAQAHAMQNIKPGMSCKEADALARDMIESAGYGAYYGHGLGHGVGVEIHEAPRVSFSSEETITEGMIITVEPGIYLPGKGGVRIEDLTHVTKDGLVALSSSPKDLIVL
jgi:Xaa-Pro aminopeptidase